MYKNRYEKYAELHTKYISWNGMPPALKLSRNTEFEYR